jgi:NADH dehydrogenase
LRRLPVFAVFGDGGYRLQPIHVEDFAALAVREGAAGGNRLINAVGPETFTYRRLVEAVGQIIGRPRRIVSVGPGVGLVAAWLIGRWFGDVMLTREEIGALRAGLLATDSPPAGRTCLTDWARDHAATLGIRYASELARRRNRAEEYERL